MPAQMTDDERFAQDWLKKRGYDAAFEPSVIVTSGRTPDFLATAALDATPIRFWAEVKSIDHEKSLVALSKAWRTIKTISIPDGLNGQATLIANAQTNEQSVRALLKMFRTKAPKFAAERTCLVFLQQHSGQRDVRYVESTDDVVCRFWARGAGSALIAVPDGVLQNGAALAKLVDAGGELVTRRAFEVFDWRSPFDCALIAWLDPSDRPLVSISSMSHGSPNTPERVINALEVANSQLRNAYTFLQAPGVVLIVTQNENLDDQMIAIAAYGKLMFPVSMQTDGSGQAYYGYDGAFRAQKNRHVSLAIRLRRNGGPPTYFLNPFAKEAVSEHTSLLRGLQCGPVSFV